MLHEPSDDCLCGITRSGEIASYFPTEHDYKMHVSIIGITSKFELINSTYQLCNSLVECAKIGCNDMPFKASAYVLSGNCE